MKPSITLSEKQQKRLAQLLEELRIVEGQIKPLQDLQKSFQMSVEAMLATLLECAGAPEDARYRLSEDRTQLILIEQQQEG